MKPSVGRIVHYESNQGTAAALVIQVNEVTVDLQVFMPDGQLRHRTGVEQGETMGTWNWPPRA